MGYSTSQTSDLFQLEWIDHHRVNELLGCYAEFREAGDPCIQTILQLSKGFNLGTMKTQGGFQTSTSKFFIFHGMKELPEICQGLVYGNCTNDSITKSRTVNRKGLQKECQLDVTGSDTKMQCCQLPTLIKKYFSNINKPKQAESIGRSLQGVTWCISPNFQTFQIYRTTSISCLITTVVHQHEGTHAQSDGDWKPMRRHPGRFFGRHHGEAWGLGPQEVTLAFFWNSYTNSWSLRDRAQLGIRVHQTNLIPVAKRITQWHFSTCFTDS